jgi:cyclophilin family peptidyl-prolyl cis-trans isomerase/HEAT repeat protein
MLPFPLLLLLLLAQAPVERAVLEIEYTRAENVAPILAALRSPEPRLQRLAARAAGRLERPELSSAVVPLLRSAREDVRREAVAALAQMGASYDFAARVGAEKSGVVRAVMYEAIGRARPAVPGGEALLTAALEDRDPAARTGAGRGLEALVRLNGKTTPLQPATALGLRRAVRDHRDSRLRQFALLALNAAGDQDAATFAVALRDEDPQVRRLAVIGSSRWVDDPSAMVRFEAVRLAGTCARALAAVADPSGHVALAAVDALGAQKCDGPAIEALVDGGRTWRIRSRALVSLAKVAPDSARGRLARFRDDPLWQVRAHAASAALLLKDETTLGTLAMDANPNVAAAAMTTKEQALRALDQDHAGLLLAAAGRLKGDSGLKDMAPRILDTIERLTRAHRATLRDPRMALIALVGEAGDPEAIEKLRPMLADRDPVVASLVARLLTEQSGRKVEPRTLRYLPEPFPSDATLRSLEGARAVIAIKGLGPFTVQLLPEEAPATVATFASLAEAGAYDGLTFHRVVPNFVLQGGSPGADEYDALTTEFMRDELGFTSHERGTLGISTRGRDTGDGQIFVNLIDNWRLDHIYTVFARTVSGMDVVDRILEGDVIESIRIQRVARPVRASSGRSNPE